MPHKDQVYIEALLGNNAKEIKGIYERFSGKIMAYVVKNNGTPEEAKDIFQEGLISIYHKATVGNFELTCPFEAYLLMVCKSKWLNVLKSSRKKKETILEDNGYNIAAVENLVNETIEFERKMHLLELKFEELGESCKSILKLSWKEVPMGEVAEKLNISYSYARKKKSECTAKLIKLVKVDPLYSKLKNMFA